MPIPVTKPGTKSRRKIPDYLIYEVMDGKPIYYRGYQSMMNRTKTLEEIIGCSSLQAELVTYILRIIFQTVDPKNTGFTPMK